LPFSWGDVNSNVLEEKNPDRWRALALLAATLVLSMTTWFSASAVIPQLREEWEISATAAAWLTIAVQLGFVCGALVSSFLNLSDVISPKRVILGGTFGAAAANGLVELVGGASIGVALRFATGFFLAGVYPPALKLMATWFQRDRGVALGILVGAIVLGQAMPTSSMRSAAWTGAW
jgi:sugar phosphate permease